MLKGPRLYPRGLDDMLAYSLVRHAYRQHKLPVFMTSGNHEAYQVRYGISARVAAGDAGNWAFKLGMLETAADAAKRSDVARSAVSASSSALHDRAPVLMGKASEWFRSVTGTTPSQAAGDGADAAARGVQGAARDLSRRLENISPGLSGQLKGVGDALNGSELAQHLTKLEEASAWVRGKANEGMSRDHNMTIYEACLAYGPTYGQALTGFNFNGGQFDWFYALFTPLADVVIAYGAKSDDAAGGSTLQAIAAMGWGTDENFKNLGEAVDVSQIGALKDYQGIDRQGAGILPRATESWSEAQLMLLRQGQTYKAAAAGNKCTLTVASHFTIVSFDEPQPYSNVEKHKARSRFWPAERAVGLPDAPAGFNQVNVGTCERGLKTYFEQCVRAGRTRPQGPAQVDWHLSGHSHRSGVYQVEWQSDGAGTPPYIQVKTAKDPGIHGAQTVAPDSQTALIVSSCGGPIGYQNLDGELSAWTGRPPAGSMLDCATGRIAQVSTSRSRAEGKGQPFNEKPRLAVALDYLHVMSGLPDKGNIKTPMYMLCMKEGFPSVIDVFMSVQLARLRCIEGMAFWVFESGRNASGDDVKKWTRVTAGWSADGKDPQRARLALEGPSLVALNTAMNAGARGKYPNSGAGYRKIAKAFCEVMLKAPAKTKAGEDWGKDVAYDKQPWVFPLDISIGDGELTPKSYWSFVRPTGEKGEVPDWDWLALNFSEKGYIDPVSAIDPYKRPKKS